MALYAFDGTWNEDEPDEGKDSNVSRFRDAYLGKATYLEGVGTREGFIGKILGGATGAGAKIRIKEMTDALEKNLEAGDRNIDIVGFSRGAALALHFANVVSEKVVSEKVVSAPIRFLGLWDVVASFGLPGNRIDIGWKLSLPDNVQHCFHAMSLDERRHNFPLTRPKPPKGGKHAAGRLEEAWFRGVHSDVGGGKSVGLSAIALCWMLRRAMGCGLAIRPERLQHWEALCDAAAPISKNLDPIVGEKREVRLADLVHESVSPRGHAGGRDHNDPPPGMGVSRDIA